MGDEHGEGGGEEEGEDVAEGGEEGVADFAVQEYVPDACPDDDDGDVGLYHIGDAAAEGVDDEDAGEDGEALCDDVPHVDI